MKNVLVVLPVTEEHKKRLEKAGEGCVLNYVGEKEVTREQVQAADIILGNVPASYLACSPRLELMQLSSSGADAYVGEGILRPETALVNSTGAYSKSVAEHTFAMILMLQKKLHLYRDDQLKAVWADEGDVVSLGSSTVAIIGLGEIGLYLARLCKAMGAKVIGVKRRMSECPDCVDELYTTDETDKVLPRADVVVSILPGTPATTHFFTPERFAMMKKSAIFINCGRGFAVSEDALYDALTTGKIATAGVDVLEREPLPSDSPLWKLPNLFITPHASGYYHLPDTLENIVDIAEYNLSAYLSGKPLKNIVDRKTGYRA